MGLDAQHGPLVRAAALALGAALIVGPAPAPAQECRLALLLGLDVSASVDAAEYALQREGLIAALGAPEIRDAFFAGDPVAFAVYEWSGRFQQTTIIDWTLVTDAGVLDAIRDRLRQNDRQSRDFPTALGYAIGHAASLFRDAPPCLFNTLDISGDGENNDGFPPVAAYQNFPLQGVTVNGLAIGGASRGIADYYAEEVIRGPGAFVEIATNHSDFARAIRAKLERELRAMILGDADEP